MAEALIHIPPANPALPANKASKPGETLRISGRNKVALDAMVWDGLSRKDAATKAGLTDHALYCALAKPHVKAYYLRQLDVLRTSERARNIHTLVEVRDQKTNQMARVVAVKTMEQIDDVEQSARGAQSMPGLQIVVIQGVPVSTDARLTHATIDASKLIDVSDG